MIRITYFTGVPQAQSQAHGISDSLRNMRRFSFFFRWRYLQSFSFLFRILFLMALVLCFFGCDREFRRMPGTVAVINGKSISFQELEAQRLTMFVGDDAIVLPDTVLREQYVDALRQILMQEVVCAYMVKKHISLPVGTVEKQEEVIRSDYPAGAFEEILVERNISLDIWRVMLTRRLMVEYFVNRELRGEVTIPAAEVEAYYKLHAADFAVPEQWHYLQITGLNKDDVERASASVATEGNSFSAQKQAGVIVRDVSMGADRLPEDISRELALLAPGKAGAVKKESGGFRVFVLLEKRSATEMAPTEIYQRVEQVLAEEKLQGIFTAWVQDRIRRADVRVASPLLVAFPENAHGK